MAKHISVSVTVQHGGASESFSGSVSPDEHGELDAKDVAELFKKAGEFITAKKSSADKRG